MDITLSELKIISDEEGFNINLIEKDYLITYLLYLLRDVKNIYFKGGTAINKILLRHARLSEDIDFTLTDSLQKVEKEIKDTLKGTLFNNITHDKKVDKFVRLIVHYKLFHDEGTIFIDLNERAKLLQKPEKREIHHFYKGYIPSFFMNTLNEEELVAEKMAATIGRNKPRDHFDLYKIIMKNMDYKQFIELGNKLKNNKKRKNLKQIRSLLQERFQRLLLLRTSRVFQNQTFLQ